MKHFPKTDHKIIKRRTWNEVQINNEHKHHNTSRTEPKRTKTEREKHINVTNNKQNMMSQNRARNRTQTRGVNM